MTCYGITQLPLIYKTIRLVQDHQSTTGIVVGVKRPLTDIFRTGKNPPRLVEFKVDEQTYQVASLIHGGRKPAYEKGQEVEVLYVPQNPAIAQINGEGGLTILLIMPACLVPLTLFSLLLRELGITKKASVETQ